MNRLLTCFVLLASLLFSCDNQDAIVVNETDEHLVLNNGVLEFNNIPFSGTLVGYYPNGVIKSKVSYKKGKKEGVEELWYDNDVLASRRYYTNGFKTGNHEGWWENGKIKFQYHFNNQGEFEGNVKEWYKNGVLYMDFNYEKGQEVGSQKLWKPDGRIKSNYEVVNGERYGLIGLKTCYTVTVGSDEVK